MTISHFRTTVQRNGKTDPDMAPLRDLAIKNGLEHFHDSIRGVGPLLSYPAELKLGAQLLDVFHQNPHLFLVEIDHNYYGLLSFLDKSPWLNMASLNKLIQTALIENISIPDANMRNIIIDILRFSHKYEYNTGTYTAIIEALMKYSCGRDYHEFAEEYCPFFFAEDINSQLVEEFATEYCYELGLNILSPHFSAQVLQELKDLDEKRGTTNSLSLAFNPIVNVEIDILDGALNRLDFFDGANLIKMPEELYYSLFQRLKAFGENAEVNAGTPENLINFFLDNLYTPKGIIEEIAKLRTFENRIFHSAPELTTYRIGAMSDLEVDGIIPKLRNSLLLDNVVAAHPKSFKFLSRNLVQNAYLSLEAIHAVIAEAPEAEEMINLNNKVVPEAFKLYFEFKYLYRIYSTIEKEGFRKKVSEYMVKNHHSNTDEIPLSYLIQAIKP